MIIRIALILVTIFCAESFAEIYKTIDKNGRTIFTDKPQETSRKVEINQVNVSPAHKGKTWSDLIKSSSPITLNLEDTNILALMDMIASYAYKTDEIIIAHQGLVSQHRAIINIDVSYNKMPWAYVVDDLSKKYDLKLEFNNDVLVVTSQY